jgi:hypothetical protein
MGIFARISNRPRTQSPLFFVRSRADVYSLPPKLSSFAVIVRKPPETVAFCPVVLKLVVSPPAERRTAVADLRLPLGEIELGAVEVVLPDELVGLGADLHDGGEEQKECRGEKSHHRNSTGSPRKNPGPP